MKSVFFSARAGGLSVVMAINEMLKKEGEQYIYE